MKQANVVLSAIFLLGLTGSLFAQSAGGTPNPDVFKAGMDLERLAKIPAGMKELVEEGTIAGAVTLVARHGLVVSLEAVGYQDLESKKPMRTDTIFNIGSMTKSLTAVGIMVLLEEGRLLLSDPVEKYLPEFRAQMMVEQSEGDKVLAVKKPSRPITIRDLLTHTSGIPEDMDIQRDQTLADNIRILAREPLEFEPGTKFWYSSAGFWTLGRIIEVVSGQPYEKFMEERVFRPLGMKDTFYVPPPEKYDRIASMYKLENGKLQKVPQPDIKTLQTRRYISPSGGWKATASDLFAFYQMVSNGGTYNGVRILSRAAVEAMTTVQTGDLPYSVPTPAGPTSQPERGYGLGWVIVLGPYAPMPFASVGSYGHGGAFGTFVWIDPKKDLVTVSLIQRSTRGSGQFAEVEAIRRMANTMAAAAIVD